MRYTGNVGDRDSVSNKQHKQVANRKLRHAVRLQLHRADDVVLPVHPREFLDNWNFAKEGK